MSSLSDLACKEVKSNGWFKFPGFCVVNTRIKAPRKAYEKVIFGKDYVVKAKLACIVVKAFPVAALKSQI